MYIAVIQPLENLLELIPITSVMGYKYAAVFDGLYRIHVSQTNGRNQIMKKRFVKIVLFLLCFSGISQAQEIKGIWAGAFEADDVFAAIGVNFDESKFVLRFAGNQQTGAIKDLQIKDGTISFAAESQPRATFTGKIEADKISGTFDVLNRDGTKRGVSVWNVRKVESLDFKDEPQPVSENKRVELPKPAGEFPIGRRFFYWTDEARAETITEDANDKRKLFVQLWYPAQKGGKIAAEYYPNLEELRGQDKDVAILRTVKTHAFQDAKLAKSKTKFPVIIFSPGLGSSPFNYAVIIENLVSRGYVVAAINHPYDSGDFKFSDGQIIRFDTEKWDRKISKDWTNEQRRQFFDERRIGWARDFSFVADQLQKLEKPFRDKLDFQNLGVFGHSFGGQAASIACASDARFKACANLDGMAQGNAILPDASGNFLKQPFLFFTKAEEARNADLQMMNLSREEYRERERKRLMRWQPSYKTRLAELDSGAYLAVYPGVNHSSFSDWLILNPNESVTVEKYAAAQNINKYIAAFFDKFLLKKNATLLDEKNNPRPPVILEFLK